MNKVRAMPILSVAQTRALEAEADALGHSYAQMMAQAGASVAEAIAQRFVVDGHHVLVLVGPGHNGGDGLVAARRLQERGAAVTAYLSSPRHVDSDAVYRAAVEAGVRMLTNDEAALQAAVRESHILIDALLGTGATPPLRGTVAEILQAVRAALTDERPALTPVRGPVPPRPHQPTIVAVDGPSSLDFDTGAIDPAALRPDLTVTFATPKWGHVQLPGAARLGELLIADIGIPESVNLPPGPVLATPDLIASWLPQRPAGAHKGTFGKATIVAGSANYTGAAVLAASAALRAGTGLVTLALPGVLHSAVVAAIPEATYLLLPNTLGVVDEHAVALLRDNLKGSDALLIGPGLGNTDESRSFLRGLLGLGGSVRSTGFVRPTQARATPSELPPLVLDADGLNILSETSGWPELLPRGAVLTPHPGEMSRLTGMATGEIQAARLDVARTWSERWHQIVVLKGAFTVVAAPDEPLVVLPFANAALAKAGTGDVLAGTIVALRAQGLDGFRAAVVGAYLHGLAGEIVAERLGAAGVVAGDVARALAEAWRRLASPDRV